MKKLLSAALSAALAASLLAGCAASAAGNDAAAQSSGAAAVTPLASATETLKAPKYVFLFIGDGMSYPQFQAASDYLGAMADSDYMQAEPSLDDNQGAVLDGPVALNFMNFEVAGSAVTYDSNSFAPDSASTATSIATGHKTYSGSINVDETATKTYETITEKVHEQLGMKVGIISSVNLNHATPAAFYAHQASRSSYYDIGLELIDSGFEYFAGGGLLKPDGHDKENPSENLYELAAKAGYNVVNTQAEAEQVTGGPVIIIDEHLADADAMAYELDRTDDMWALADYVEKGIQVLDNENGFFMMCEGGKVDWACHANDAASTIHDTLALADAVQVAVDFAKDHADETLILVTGDHETGGLTIGFAGTDYDTYLSLLSSQKISFAKYDSDYVSAYKTGKTSFEDVLKDIENLFGLKAQGEEGDKLVLTDYEKSLLKTAYEKSVNEKDTGMAQQQEYVAYGTYEPLTVTITHILNNKSGVSFTSYSHTGLPVGVFADGVNAQEFKGYFDNTEIYHKLANMLNVK
ncbi:alkaline phosphatase [Pseudoflavonifractor phocaeensis]|uniref:alkaline phosphatase n=1 Tax=Pseudoflavonifractor phocaeensis TaxID=1870988 RepID=UPI001F2B8FFE|nr:alkaline phosphatase [Pseudoflavonifractor phocaeensis]MCF2661091.1 alkaline phosphatase [Pseudoflavonifractor phocaeensis]